MRKLSLFIVALILSVPVLAASLVERTILNNLVTIQLPADFTPLDEQIKRRKFPSGNPPQLVYANKNAAVSIGFTYNTRQKLTPAQLPDLQKLLVKGLKQVHPNAIWHQETIKTIHGRQWVILEFTTQAVDGPIRNLMAATSANTYLLLTSFNTTRALEKRWLPVGRQMINSIKVNAQ